MLLAPHWPDVNVARISGTPQINSDANRAVGDEEPRCCRRYRLGSERSGVCLDDEASPPLPRSTPRKGKRERSVATLPNA